MYSDVLSCMNERTHRLYKDCNVVSSIDRVSPMVYTWSKRLNCLCTYGVVYVLTRRLYMQVYLFEVNKPYVAPRALPRRCCVVIHGRHRNSFHGSASWQDYLRWPRFTTEVSPFEIENSFNNYTTSSKKLTGNIGSNILFHRLFSHNKRLLLDIDY